MSESKLKKQKQTQPEAKADAKARVVKPRNPKRLLFICGGLAGLIIVSLAIVLVVRHIQDAHKRSPADVAFQKAINATSNNVPASDLKTFDEALSAGDIYDAKLEYQQAYAAYQQALKLTSRPPYQLYDDLGNEATALGKKTEAKQYYQKELTAAGANQLSDQEKQTIEDKINQ